MMNAELSFANQNEAGEGQEIAVDGRTGIYKRICLCGNSGCNSGTITFGSSDEQYVVQGEDVLRFDGQECRFVVVAKLTDILKNKR